MLRTICKGTAVLALAGLAACGDSTGPSGLTPEQVSAFYDVCELSFVPVNSTQKPVDIRAVLFTGDPQAVQPLLAVDVSRTFQFLYTENGHTRPTTTTGTYTLSATQVLLKFDEGTNPSGALLPDRLPLDFQGGTTLMLTAAAGYQYDVPKATYAQLAGISEAGLADQIPGNLEATFASPRCP